MINMFWARTRVTPRFWGVARQSQHCPAIAFFHSTHHVLHLYSSSCTGKKGGTQILLLLARFRYQLLQFWNGEGVGHRVLPMLLLLLPAGLGPRQLPDGQGPETQARDLASCVRGTLSIATAMLPMAKCFSTTSAQPLFASANKE